MAIKIPLIICHFVFIIIMFVLQCFIKSGLMTNSLLAVYPAVQHMVLHLMNINTLKYKWSWGMITDVWETPADVVMMKEGLALLFCTSLVPH